MDEQQTKKIKSESESVALTFSKMGAAFDDTLKTLRDSNATPSEILLKNEPSYVDKISFDPTTALNFKLFQTDPTKRIDPK